MVPYPKQPKSIQRLRSEVSRLNLPVIEPLPSSNELGSLKKAPELSSILKYYFLTYGDEIEKLNTLIKDPKIKILVSLIARSIKFVAKKFYAH